MLDFHSVLVVVVVVCLQVQTEDADVNLPFIHLSSVTYGRKTAINLCCTDAVSSEQDGEFVPDQELNTQTVT